MADIKLLIPKILEFEGGYVDDPLDRGGATNLGVTLETWRKCGYDKDGDGDIDKYDIRLLNEQDFIGVLKRYYWDRWKADQIITQCVAEILVDWVYCSGKWGIVIPQRILKIPSDGVVGVKTLAAVNSADPFTLFQAVKQARIDFVDGIIKSHPDQVRFEKGWKRRINSYLFTK